MMKQEIIIPITPNDFKALDIIIGNNDKFCSYCDGKLKTSAKGIFATGIFYKCQRCKREYKKTKFIFMTDGKNYFQLLPKA